MFARIKRVNSTGKGMILTFPTEAPSYPPYGTMLGSGNEPLVLNWNYGNLSRSGSFQWGNVDYAVLADGVGGTFISYGTTYETASYDDVIDDYEFNNNTRIIYKGSNGTWNECTRWGATGYVSYGSANVDINGNSFQIGNTTITEYYTGFCSVYNDTTTDWYMNGTYITTYYDNPSETTYDAYCDGYGSYYTVPQ